MARRNRAPSPLALPSVTVTPTPSACRSSALGQVRTNGTAILEVRTWGCSGLRKSAGVRTADSHNRTHEHSRKCVTDSCQLVEQRLGVLEVRSAEAFGEPAVDGGEEVSGLGGFAMRVPQAGEAGRGVASQDLADWARLVSLRPRREL